VNEKQRFQLAAVESLAGGKDAPLVATAAPALGPSVDPRAVVLVEGISDQVALEALAERRGRDLAAEGIAVVPMGGARNIRHFLERFGPRGLNLRLAGLCDAREEGDFRRGLERAGLGANLRHAEMEALGFYVCVADLEDELLRCLGAACVEQLDPLRTRLWRCPRTRALQDRGRQLCGVGGQCLVLQPGHTDVPGDLSCLDE
jgi:hypothetical protein